MKSTRSASNTSPTNKCPLPDSSGHFRTQMRCQCGLRRTLTNCALYDLEGELWELQFCRELVQHTLAIVAGVHKVTVLVREDERFERWIRTLLLPAPEISRQLPGDNE